MEIICNNTKCIHNTQTHCKRDFKFITLDENGVCAMREYDEFNDENVVEAMEKPYNEFKAEGRLVDLREMKKRIEESKVIDAKMTEKIDQEAKVLTKEVHNNEQ